jgi:hypothetical protein
LPRGATWMCAATAGAVSFENVSFQVSLRLFMVAVNVPAPVLRLGFGTDWRVSSFARSVAVAAPVAAKAIAAAVRVAAAATSATAILRFRMRPLPCRVVLTCTAAYARRIPRRLERVPCGDFMTFAAH